MVLDTIRGVLLIMQDKDNETETIIKEKASYFFNNKLKAHIKLKPVGFIDSIFLSDLQETLFYWVLDNRTNAKRRIFLNEIFDILDFNEKETKKESENDS